MKLSKRIEVDKIKELEHSLAEEAQPEKDKTQKQPLILGIGLGGVIGVLLALLPCYFIFQHYVVNENARQITELTTQRAELLASKIERYLQAQSENIGFFAQQASLHKAMLNGDQQGIRQTVDLAASQIDGLIAINALAREQAALDIQRFPPIRFTELALLKDAESGNLPQPEFGKIEGDRVLYFVRPIRAAAESQAKQDGDIDDKADNQPPGKPLIKSLSKPLDNIGVKSDNPVSGVLWLVLSTERLLAILDAESQSFGKVELHQNLSRRDRILVLSRREAEAESSTPVVLPIKDTNWEVSVAAGPQGQALVHIQVFVVYGMMIAVAALGLVIGGGIGAYIGHRAQQAREHAMMERKANRQPKSSHDLGHDALDQLIDVEIHQDDSSLLGLSDADEVDQQDRDDEQASAQPEAALSLDDEVFDLLDDDADRFPEVVFRAYDIRGIAGEQINKDFALSLGKALGSEVLELGEQTLAVARDARTHSPELTEYLIRGLLSTGCNVLNLGTVPTPLMYFALETMDEVASGVVVTASHNPAEYNGFKTIVSGVSRSSEDIQKLRAKMNKADFISGDGKELRHDIVPSYIETIFSDVALASEMHVVVDAGNAVGGKVAPQLFEELGCRVEPLFCDLDGSFPNHVPDPSQEENLTALIAKVKDMNADLGIALDGDADRLTVVSSSGKVYSADRLLMLFAKDIVSRSPGADVVFDVKSTRHLNACITGLGGRPVMWKTGHSHMRLKMRETRAVVGAEYSGHIFIQDRWYGFDDGMYAAARLLEILSLQGETLDEALSEFPESLISPEYRIHADDEKKFDIVEKLKQTANFTDGRVTDIDGVRVDFGHGWGLVRASNTAPELTLRFEADNEEAMHEIKSLFVRELKNVDASLDFNWN